MKFLKWFAISVFVLLALVIVIIIAAGDSGEPAPVAPPPAPATTTTEEISQESFIDDEQYYINAVQEQGMGLGTALTNLGQLFQDANLTDTMWTYQVAIEVAAIRQYYQDALVLTPPTNLEKFHIKYIAGMEHLDNAMILLIKAVDELDETLLDGVLNEMTIGGNQVTEAFSNLVKYINTK